MAPSVDREYTVAEQVPEMVFNSTNGSNEKASSQAPNWVPVLELPIHTPRRLRIICIGAGYAGLMLAYKIKYQMKMADVIDLCIYEKNHDVGGTWLENRYPGVAW